FVLSGFLVTRSFVLTQSAMRYAAKRAARIVPAFLVASVFGLIVAAIGSDNATDFSRSVDWRHYLLGIFTFHGSGFLSFPHNVIPTVNGTLWTIRYEIDCYILIGLLGLTGLLSRSVVLAAFLALAASYALQSLQLLSIPRITYGVGWFLAS